MFVDLYPLTQLGIGNGEPLKRLLLAMRHSRRISNLIPLSWCGELMGTDCCAIEQKSREAEIATLLLAITDNEDANELDMTMDISIHPLGFNCCSNILLLPLASLELSISTVSLGMRRRGN